MEMFDTIVVGAGIEGSATAYHLAKSNKRTLLLEQFFLPHSRGSSHGQSRIIRKAYSQEHYANMMKDAYEMWHTLEEEACTKLFQKTGLLVVARPPHDDYVESCDKALAAAGSVYQRLTAEQINKQFPMMRFNKGDVGIFEKEAGVLFADKCLSSFHKMFLQYGGILRDGEPVTKITPGSVVTVETPKGRYQARSIVIAAGPWTSKVVKPLGLTLPLKPLKIRVCYWKQEGDAYTVDNGFPCCIFVNVPSHHFYALPSIEYPSLVKVCSHFGSHIDPDGRDLATDFTDDIEKLENLMSGHFLYAENKPSITETCIYTVTPDEDFILDTHPQYSNIVIGAGFSGHGFKLAPMVGKILAQVASKEKPNLDMRTFSMHRFNQPKARL